MTQSMLFGVDVAKAELVIYDGSRQVIVPNQRAAIRRWLRSLPAGAVLGMESTGIYHQLLADLAVAAGFKVYVISARALKHYRPAIGQRAKTDRCDAELIWRYLQHELAQLRPYVPLSEEHRRWRSLLRRRARVVSVRITLRQSLAGVPGLKAGLQDVLSRIERLIAQIDQTLETIGSATPERAQQRRALQTIVGVGPLVSLGIQAAFETGEFQTADSFVAFSGLDPKPCDSGTSKGRRRLSKQGDRELRRLLFVAALSASRTKLWRPLYLRYRQRGRSAVEACVILARKIARIAWAIRTHQTTFNPALVQIMA